MQRRFPAVLLTYSALVALLSILMLAGCNSSESKSGKTSTAKAAAGWETYVSEHTGSLVSKKSPVRIRFVNEVASENQVGQNAENVLTAEPPIEGSTTFSNRREIVLVPKEPLKAGQRYNITVRAAKLAGIPQSLGDYTFSFEVKKQEFEVHLQGLTVNPTDETQYVVEGTVATADVDEADHVEKIIGAQFLGTKLPIAWRHDIDGRSHSFTISGISRQDEASQVKVSWSGDPIAVESHGSRDIDIPAKDVFQVVSIQPVQSDRQYISINFSDALDAKQNLNGLVRLDSDNFSFRVEGSTLKIYSDHSFDKAVTVTLEPGIKGAKGGTLKERSEQKVFFASEKPQVRFVGKGVILPDNDTLTIPFEAVSVNSVQVTAFEVYDNNIGQFLQNNKLDGSEELYRVGRYLWRKTIPLSAADPSRWNRFSLDATELLRKHPGSLLRLTLSINRKDAIFNCPGDKTAASTAQDEPLNNSDDIQVNQNSGWDGAEDYYNEEGEGSSWEDRKNPCKNAYYRQADGVKASRNFLASNIGIIAKLGTNGQLHVVTTDLRNAVPIDGVNLHVINFQNREIGRATTDGDGMATVALQEKPFYISAEKSGQIGYLKVNDNAALPVSHFDIGGEQITKGIKGYIYGERDVWRPGDKIYLTFVLQDKDGLIPRNHPVTMQLISPQGQLIQSITNNSPVGEFYTFTLKTGDDAPTGSWTAKAILGGSTFSKSLQIETVVPNRLKVELDFGEEKLHASDKLKGKLFAQWLHGAKASDLHADVAVTLAPRPTHFSRFADYVFDDPAREFQGERQVIFDDTLDQDGKATFTSEIQVDKENAPGMLAASFASRVFEKGGAFSSSHQTFDFHPFDDYVGIKLPKGDATRGMLLTDTDHTVSIVSVNADGDPVSVKRVEVTLYKIDWKWWWDKSGESLANFAQSSYTNKLQQEVVSTKDGRGSWTFKVKYPDWGRYLVRACDLDGGHCTGKTVYIDWPGWAGRAQEDNGAGANVLNFFSDKPNYTVGEEATIQLPDATKGRALVSVENGIGVIEQRWVEFGKGNTSLKLPITAAMAPNVYVSVTLVQPHKDRDNDRPIRLYGITPLMVQDPATRLKPHLVAPDETKPQSKLAVEVSEENGREMTYTLALVDEGLLGLTNYRTPDLHKYFYRKEALGVGTWDVFDYVVGAYGGELERLLALGGSDDEEAKDNNEDKKRFPPVVRFMGPFTLKAGETNKHTFDIPQYIGAVRVMLVAGEKGAYGSADKSVTVREPLAMLSTLPRVLSPGEELQVPVSLFVTDPAIKSVDLKLEADTDHFETMDGGKTTIAIDGPGEKIGFLRLKVKDRLGKGHIKFIADGHTSQTDSEVYIDVTSPNARSVRLQRSTIEPGQEWSASVVPHGLQGTNRVVMEVSAVPPINLEGRLDYLIRYPHGCVEQTTSSVFPQLSLPALVKLEPPQRAKVDKNIEAGIERLRSFQTSEGGFAYWPGNGDASAWGSNYAGHFLIEAQKHGYFVPAEMMSAWLGYQQRVARSWVAGTGSSELDQAYRLYTLALADKPEFGAMNRMHEQTGLSSVARWQLAAAYQLAGMPQAADTLIADDHFVVADYPVEGSTFGSTLRDKAIILNGLVTLGRFSDAKTLADEVSAQLSSGQWLSTQSVAYGLLAMTRFVGAGDADKPITFTYRSGDAAETAITATSPIFSHALKDFPQQGTTVTLKNTSQRKLFGTILVEGVPRAGEETDDAQGLVLRINYADTNGNPLNITRLKQGTDVMASISVTNTSGQSLENIALTEIVPSGWEIHNARFNGESGESATIDYQDIRDDRIYTYFALKEGETKQFKALFNASYLGRFYQPGVAVESMYDAAKHARVKGQWVEVVKTLD